MYASTANEECTWVGSSESTLGLAVELSMNLLPFEPPVIRSPPRYIQKFDAILSLPPLRIQRQLRIVGIPQQKRSALDELFG